MQFRVPAEGWVGKKGIQMYSIPKCFLVGITDFIEAERIEIMDAKLVQKLYV
jgi:hypothetical protein